MCQLVFLVFGELAMQTVGLCNYWKCNKIITEIQPTDAMFVDDIEFVTESILLVFTRFFVLFGFIVFRHFVRLSKVSTLTTHVAA